MRSTANLLRCLGLMLLAAVALAAAAGNSRPSESSVDRNAAAQPPVAQRSSEPTSDATGIREAFERYKRAARRSDGPAVAPLVSAESIAHYGRLRTIALAGTRAQLDALNHIDRMQVLMLRQLLTQKELEAMKPKGVVEFAFDRHMMGEDLEETSTFDNLEIAGRSATARHIARNRPAGGPLREATFRWEKNDGGQWMLDLLHILKQMEVQLEDVHQMDPTRSKDALATSIVEAFTNQKLEDEHYRAKSSIAKQ